MRFMAGLVTVLIGLSAHAETAEEAAQRTNRVLQEATAAARSYYGTPAPAAPLLQPDALRRMGSIDPAEIASRYQDLTKRPEFNKPTHELLIFVSTSMPPQTLRLLALQAARAGGIVEFRGLRKGLEKGSLEDMAKVIKPMADTGANIQIDPEAFKRHQVDVVPTIVIAKQVEGCAENICPVESASIVGDVTLAYALEKLEGRSDAIGKLAAQYLIKLKQ